MHYIRLLVLKEHPNFDYVFVKRILVNSFLFGIYDRKFDAFLDVLNSLTAADAKRLVAEGEAVRRDQRSRCSNIEFLNDGACVDNPDDVPGADLEPHDLAEEEVIGVLSIFGAIRRGDTQLANYLKGGIRQAV